MSDLSRSIQPLDQIARLTAGDAFIFRHYELAEKVRHVQALHLRNECRHRHIRFLIAGDRQLAINTRADGLHLPGWQLRRGLDWHNRPRPNWLVTAAAHKVSDLIQMRRCGIDAGLLSPVFPTSSHPGRKTIGVVRFAKASTHAGLPVYALGGMTDKAVQRLRDTCLAGFAAISLE